MISVCRIRADDGRCPIGVIKRRMAVMQALVPIGLMEDVRHPSVMATHLQDAASRPTMSIGRSTLSKIVGPAESHCNIEIRKSAHLL